MSMETLKNIDVQVNSLKAEQIDLFLTEIKKREDIIKDIEEIRLFGSVLSERCREDSDVDMCIILKDSINESDFETGAFVWFIYDIFEKGFETDRDFVILTRKNYTEQINDTGVISEIERCGKTVYKEE